ncbi:hypothetical protein Hanom_Chr09g00857411 [Helianthus anomalus]
MKKNVLALCAKNVLARSPSRPFCLLYMLSFVMADFHVLVCGSNFLLVFRGDNFDPLKMI